MDILHLPEPAVEVEPSPEFVELWNWAISQGVKCPKLKYPVRFGAGYIGAQALDRIGPLEPMVSVPRKLMLNTKAADDSEIAPIYSAHPEVFSNTDLEPEDLKIITYIFAELKKGRESFWYYLLRTLAKDVEVLCDWSAEEMEEMQDGNMIQESNWKLEYIHKNWEGLEPVLRRYPEHFSEETVNFDTFYWLWKTLSTRAFGKYNPSCSIVPLADLVNHTYCHSFYIIGEPDDTVGGAPDICILDTTYQDPEVFLPVPSYSDLLKVTSTSQSLSPETYTEMSVFASDIQAAIDKEEEEEVWGGPWDVDEEAEPVFSLRAGTKEEYAAGSQLSLFYGHYSNRQLLLHYGFTMERNVYNYARVTISLCDMTSDPTLISALHSAGLEKPRFFSIHQFEICMSLLQKLRSLNWQSGVHSPEAYFYPRDSALEIQVMDKGTELLIREIKKFPTSIEEDEIGLKSPRSLRHYFAVRLTQIVYRLGLKKSLRNQCSFFQALKRVMQLRLEGQSLEQALDSLPPGESYENGVVSPRKSLSKYLVQLKIAQTSLFTPVFLIETVAEYFQYRANLAVSRLMHEMLVSVAIEGAPMRRAGSISLISISTFSGNAYIFDVQKCGKGLWDSAQGRKTHGLKHLLESRRTLKIMHDCRLSSDVLWHVAHIGLNYVLDTQVAFKVYRNSQGVSNVLPIGSNKFCLMFLELDIANFTEVRRAMREDPLYWKARPLTSEAIAYLADLSSLLMSTWASFRPQIPEDLIQRIMQESFDRLNEFREDEDPHPEVKGSEQFHEMIKNANTMEPPPPTVMVDQGPSYAQQSKGLMQFVSPEFLRSPLIKFRFDTLVISGLLERMEADLEAI